MSDQKPGAICVGEAFIELARGADGRFSLSCGGDTFNTAIYLARAGIDAAFASAVGDDPYSDSVLALTQTLNGSATLTATQGALVGLNVEQLLRRLELRPLSGGGDFRRGRTPFDKITMGMKLAAGTATVEHVTLESPATSAYCFLHGRHTAPQPACGFGTAHADRGRTVGRVGRG